MQNKIFIIIRYSFLNAGKESHWRIQSTASFQEYKLQLFAPERLALRERLFRNITLPSIIAARANFNDPDAVTLLVQTSVELPTEFMRNLREMLSPHPWIRLVPMAATTDPRTVWKLMIAEEMKKVGVGATYATVRVDDDDGLAADFLSALDQYIRPKFVGFVVSFAKGIRGEYDSTHDCIMRVIDVNHPRIALGLSFINSFDQATDSFMDDRATIFDCGSHVEIDKFMPMILDSRATAYFHTVHPANDTAIGGPRKTILHRIKRLVKSCLTRKHSLTQMVSLRHDSQRREEVRRLFSIHDEALPKL